MKKYLLIALLGLVGVSCSEDTMDNINKDTSNPPVDKVPAKLMITDAIMSSAFTTVSGAYAWYVSSYTEQEFGTGNNQLMKIETRNRNEMASSTTFNNEWNGTYSNLNNLKQIIEKINTKGGVDEGQSDILGMAQVLYALNFGILTDLHGDIPCSEALKGLENLTPKIDKQEDIYKNAVLGMLDSAIENLNAAIATKATNAGAQDILFGNDNQKWLASAYALKARYLMHTMKKNSSVLPEVIAACNSAITYGFEGMDLNAFDGNASTNPWFAYYESREYTASSTTVTNLMSERKDPREDVYAFPYYYYGDIYEYVCAPGNEELAKEVGGLSAPAWLSYRRSGYDPASAYCGGGSASVHLMSYTELYYILAEAKTRLGQDATSEFTKATAASIKEYDSFLNIFKAEYAAYLIAIEKENENLAEDKKITPKSYKDYLATPIAEYIKANVTPLFTANPLKEIMVQKYISQCRDEQIETYNDFRRCKALGEEFVVMTNPRNAGNNLPVCLPYGNSSVLANPAVKAAYGDGSYVFTKNVWIFE